MGQISFLSVLTVTFPEEFLITILGVLAIGKFKYLKNKTSYIQIAIIALISSISSHFIRNYLDNELENILVSIFILTLLYLFVSRFKFYESIVASLFAIIILAIVQTPILLSVLAITNVSLDQILSDDLKLFLFVLPERLAYVALIFLSFRFNIKIFDFETATIKKKEYYIQLFVYVVSIGTLIFLSILMAKTLLFDHGDLVSETNSLLLRINIYLTLFITIVLTFALRNTHDYYKNKAALNNNEFIQNLDYISTLVKEENYKEAEQAIQTLKIHINNI